MYGGGLVCVWEGGEVCVCVSVSVGGLGGDKSKVMARQGVEMSGELCGESDSGGDYKGRKEWKTSNHLHVFIVSWLLVKIK